MRHFRQALTANLFKERLAIASVVVELVGLLGSAYRPARAVCIANRQREEVVAR